MNLTPVEMAVLATLVFFSFLFLLLYLRSNSALNSTVLLNEQEQYFHSELLENKVIELEASQLLTESLQSQNNKLTVRLRESEVRLQAGQQRLRDQQASEEKLSSQFELLSQRIFNDKSVQFKALNQESLSQLLAPFKVQLEGFKQQVSDCYINEQTTR